MIELAVDEDALVARIIGRFTCAKCGAAYHDSFKPPKVPGVCDVCGSTEFKRRPDDNEQTVRTRMAEYRAKTAPILPYYEARGLVRRVDGMASVEEVAAQIDAILDGAALSCGISAGGANEISCALRPCSARLRRAPRSSSASANGFEVRETVIWRPRRTAPSSRSRDTGAGGIREHTYSGDPPTSASNCRPAAAFASASPKADWRR